MSASVLVVGGAGYIGSHTCKALARAGYRPVVFDDLSEGHREAVRWGELIEGDIADRRALEDALERSGATAIVHFAARAYVGESVRDPAIYWRNNVVGTTNLADAAVAAGIEPIVFSSSCATYGGPREGAERIDEDAPQRPVSPYGRTKLACEWLLKDYGAAGKLRPAILRYFNAAGADPDGEVGEAHRVETHLIPLAVLAAQGKAPPLRVFGTDYPTADGSAVRDYVHVEDLADAHVAAVRHLLEGGGSVEVNVGTGQGASVLEVIDAVERVGGKPVPRTMEGRREGDPPRLVADPARAEAVLGFRARWTELDDIVRSAWAWHDRRAA